MEPHLGKCFDGIGKLVFGEGNIISGLNNIYLLAMFIVFVMCCVVCLTCRKGKAKLKDRRLRVNHFGKIKTKPAN